MKIAKAVENEGQNAYLSRINPLKNDAYVSIFENDKFPYYFYGSIAISEEIKEIENILVRLDPEIHVIGLADINSKIRKINQDQLLKRYQETLEITPLMKSGDDFKIFNYDIELIKLERLEMSNIYIFIILSFLGLISGLFLIFLKYIKLSIPKV